jgi:pimeloyl-ACP methyl ester carboxylesterase
LRRVKRERSTIRRLKYFDNPLTDALHCMTGPIPSLLIPGLLGSARLYAEQVPHLWRLGPVTIADHTRDDSMAAIARRILALAPPRFALIGISMGGYLCFEIMRQSPERVEKLVLLDTSSRPDTQEQSEARRTQMALAKDGRIHEVLEAGFPHLVHPKHRADQRLRDALDQMAAEVGVEAFVRQQLAIIGRADSRPGLSAIHCPSLVLVGDSDELTPPDRAAEIANGISGARLVTVPEAGHATPLEQPEFVTRTLLEFLQS